ncbi:hypothetical protein [Sphingomonas sanxanigenens]|uniref:Uncharacterized protein n=1 Tax=Sphingomonas sanxanigenens DSM 19645 = NX02 TaxID=1123269 RepID=W0AJV0_9SPHN|nr:hypothetical protein [Sphingomonas sanxanigenens]AHE57416.1 hypothetical protein NX02_29240 [Sphingomonas sanxanigenens DSM 19645 = NX02]
MIDEVATIDAPSSAFDITAGISDGAFSDLNPHQRRMIIILASRAAERAYRRGFQQGAHIATERPANLPTDLHAWRYGASADLAPWADCPAVEPSIERLYSENKRLYRIGLAEECSQASREQVGQIAGILRACAQALIDARLNDPDDENENGALASDLVDAVDTVEAACPNLLTEVLTGRRHEMSAGVVREILRAIEAAWAGS